MSLAVSIVNSETVGVYDGVPITSMEPSSIKKNMLINVGARTGKKNVPIISYVKILISRLLVSSRSRSPKENSLSSSPDDASVAENTKVNPIK